MDSGTAYPDPGSPGIWADLALKVGDGVLLVNVNFPPGAEPDPVAMHNSVVAFGEGVATLMAAEVVDLPAPRYSAVRRAEDATGTRAMLPRHSQNGDIGGEGGSERSDTPFSDDLPGENNLEGVVWYWNTPSRQWPVAPDGTKVKGWQWSIVKEVRVDRFEGENQGHVLCRRLPGFEPEGSNRRQGGLTLWDSDRGVNTYRQLRNILDDLGIKVEFGDPWLDVQDRDIWVAFSWDTKKASRDGTRPAADPKSTNPDDFTPKRALYIRRGAPQWPDDYTGFVHWKDRSKNEGPENAPF